MTRDHQVGALGVCGLVILGVTALATGCDHEVLALTIGCVAGIAGYHVGKAGPKTSV